MPNKIKYTREQRNKAYEMYEKDRHMENKYKKGKYTLKQISEATGIEISSCLKICTGQR